MTSKKTLKVCDFCAQDIKSEMAYNIKIAQRPLEYVKGKLVKCDSEPDMCHPCFMKICENGFKPEWTTLIKDQLGKWNPLEEQTKLNE